MNLAAELAGAGVTFNVYRPGGVDTAMQAWIRGQDPERIGGLYERFHRNYAEGTLITPEQSAAGLLAHLAVAMTPGPVWEVSTPPREPEPAMATHRLSNGGRGRCSSSRIGGVRSPGPMLPASAMVTRIWATYSGGSAQAARWASNRRRRDRGRAFSRSSVTSSTI